MKTLREKYQESYNNLLSKQPKDIQKRILDSKDKDTNDRIVSNFIKEVAALAEMP